MSEKEMFLQSWEREFQTTMKVLKAYPPDKTDFKPHEKSRSAKDLAWTFVHEEAVINQVLDGEVKFGPPPPVPNTWQELLSAYEKSHSELVKRVSDVPEAALNNTIKFPVGPKQMADLRSIDVFWFMMMDMIHHRGQFSVYLRMAGGKVPSIYGPSLDEPWM